LISFLRHFIAESGEIQSACGGENFTQINCLRAKLFDQLLLNGNYFFIRRRRLEIFGFHPRPPRLSDERWPAGGKPKNILSIL
jgi:hypothetical protein